MASSKLENLDIYTANVYHLHNPKNKFYHITHLIKDAKNLGKKIGVFPVDDEAWIDIGQWTEYQKAIDKF